MNPIEKVTVAILLDSDVVAHLPQGKLGRYAKQISFYLQADARNVCTVVVIGQAVNLVTKGMQVPCNLCFSCTHLFLEATQ